MKHWAKSAAIVVLAAVVTFGLLRMYSTWRDCSAAGGTTVRGLFGLECIK